MSRTRLAAAGFIWGPGVFIAAWVIGGALTPGHSPVSDAISQLAAVGADTKHIMDLGFVVYGVGVISGAYALRSQLGRAATAAFVCNGVLTFGVWLTPLDRSVFVDVAHGVFAAAAYVALVTALLLAAREIPVGRNRDLVTALGGVVGLCLLLTAVVEPASGLFQRVGLTLADAWLITTGWQAITPTVP